MDARLCEVTLALARRRPRNDRPRGRRPRRGPDRARRAARPSSISRRWSTLLGGPADFVDHMDQHLKPAPIVRDVFADGRGHHRRDRHPRDRLGRRHPRRRPTPAHRHHRSRVGFDRLLGLGATTGPRHAARPHPCPRRGDGGRSGSPPHCRLSPRRQTARCIPSSSTGSIPDAARHPLHSRQFRHRRRAGRGGLQRWARPCRHRRRHPRPHRRQLRPQAAQPRRPRPRRRGKALDRQRAPRV